MLAVGSGAKEDRESAVKLSGVHGVQALSWTADGKLLTACTTVHLWTCTICLHCCCGAETLCFEIGLSQPA